MFSSLRVFLSTHGMFLFWAATVTVCGLLGVRAFEHWTEANELDRSKRRVVADYYPARRQNNRELRRVRREGDAMIRRNIFCSNCSEEALVSDSPERIFGLAAAPTLRLLATHVAPQPARSLAVLDEHARNIAGGFGIGDDYPRVGALRRIGADFVGFTGVEDEELLSFWDAREAPPSPPSTAAPDNSEAKKERRRNRRNRNKRHRRARKALQAGLEQIGDNTYRISRNAVLDALEQDIGMIGMTAMFEDDASGTGIRLANLRKEALARVAGFREGDLILSINGVGIDSEAAMIAVPDVVAGLQHMEVELLRDNAPLVLTYVIQ